MEVLTNNGTKNPAAAYLSELFNASVTMKAELERLMQYLEICGYDSLSYAGDFAKKNDIDGALSKKEGVLMLDKLKNALINEVCLPLEKTANEPLPSDPASATETASRAPFSEIYAESAVLSGGYPLAREILSRFPGAKLTEISHFKDVFNRAGQDFTAQKRSPALILAVNNGAKIYPGARPCQSFGHEHFYYTSQIKNCIYDCEYCFLRGMYPSANIVIFVNTGDYFAEIQNMLKEHPVYLSIAYDTDLPAFESFTGLTKKWCGFAAENPSLLIEIRTKCGSKAFADNILETGKGAAPENIILSYTVSPAAVAARFEHGAGTYAARKNALLYALKKGLRTRLCLDPLLPVRDFEKHYGEMIDDIFSDPLSRNIEDISVGSFRISKSYMKNMKKSALTPVSAYPYVLEYGMCVLDAKTRRKLCSFVTDRLSLYFPKEKIFEA